MLAGEAAVHVHGVCSCFFPRVAAGGRAGCFLPMGWSLLRRGGPWRRSSSRCAGAAQKMALAGTMRCVTGDEQWVSEGAGGTLMLGAKGHPSSDHTARLPVAVVPSHVKDHPKPRPCAIPTWKWGLVRWLGQTSVSCQATTD